MVQQLQMRRYPFLSVCVVFSCVQTMAAPCHRLGFVTCTHMLMHVIAHRGCMDTVVQSAVEVNSGRKITSRISIAPFFSVGCSAKGAIPAPYGFQRLHRWWNPLWKSWNRLLWTIEFSVSTTTAQSCGGGGGVGSYEFFNTAMPNKIGTK